ncbi:MAG: DUF4436 family protein [Microbacterium pygmaeum]
MALEQTAPTRRPRVPLFVIVLVAALVGTYLAVIALYALNERTVTIDGCTEDPPADAILLSLDPETMDAAADRLGANLDVVSFGPVAAKDSSLLTAPLTVLVTDNDGPRSIVIPPEELPSPHALRLITTGSVERWPFDAHSVDVAFASLQTVDGEVRSITTVLCGSAHVPGWTFASEEIPGTDELTIDGEPVAQIRVIATRSPATVAFGIVILALMVVLPVLGLTVAILAYRGLRKVEATLMSWMAAMLFATIPLRTFLPGSPPIGSWVDYLLVLWVLAGLVIGLAIYVAAWVRWTPAAVAPDRP